MAPLFLIVTRDSRSSCGSLSCCFGVSEAVRPSVQPLPPRTQARTGSFPACCTHGCQPSGRLWPCLRFQSILPGPLAPRGRPRPSLLPAPLQGPWVTSNTQHLKEPTVSHSGENHARSAKASPHPSPTLYDGHMGSALACRAPEGLG